jgi:hypothetical protein
MEVLLKDWPMPTGGLYFVTPAAGVRPAKVEALAAFFAEHLSTPGWRWPR